MILSLYSPLRARAEEPPPLERIHFRHLRHRLSTEPLSLCLTFAGISPLSFTAQNQVSLFLLLSEKKPAPLETTGHFFNFLSLFSPVSLSKA